MRARRDRRVQALGEPDVFLADVDVDEPAQLAAVVHDPPGDTGIFGVQARDDLAQRPCGRR